jgi:two-component system chemotaxis sensor kinase CheA
MAKDPYRYFRLEARDLLEQFAGGTLELERNGAEPAIVQRLLRVAHTLKGAARVVKQGEIADLAHALEDALSPFRDAVGVMPAVVVETLLTSLDEMGARVLALSEGEASPASGQPPGPAATRGSSPDAATPGSLPGDEGPRTVRVDIAEMDALLEGIAEAHALLSGLRTAGALATRTRHLADLLQDQLAARGGQGPHRPRAESERAYRTAEELRRRLDKLERDLGSSAEQMDRELSQLRDAAEQLRLMSAGTLLGSLERTARDTAHALGKPLTFATGGGDIRLDAFVLTTIQRALVQIVRNAVAHGIEPTMERLALGKPAAGAVSINVARRGGQIVFDCRDDGRGIDLEAIRGMAIARGLAPSDARDLNTEGIVGLLLRGGISTSDTVTEVSGRGVGLDVVREAVEQIGGRVAVTTEPGVGTAFELIVPLSLAALDILLVETSENAVAIPLDAARTSMRIAASEISWSSTGASVLFERTAIPFVSLSTLLFGDRRAPSRDWSAIVIAGAGGTAAIGVDRLLGAARVVVRPLPAHTPASAMVAGTSLDAEGNPRLILDPEGLISEARRMNAAGLGPPPSRPPVLVIDDSLTTRMLEQSILESAGYEADVAVSAEDGLESAKRKRYALFLVDVEMPGMDGFAFVECIRASPDLHDIPAILVTSRGAPEDRQRGRDAGAQGYIVKSEFDQNELLSMIRPLVSNP